MPLRTHLELEKKPLTLSYKILDTLINSIIFLHLSLFKNKMEPNRKLDKEFVSYISLLIH